MRVVISNFPGVLITHPEHPLEVFSCDITNYLIVKGICDDEDNVPNLVGVEFDKKENGNYCSMLILELKDDWLQPITLAYVIEYVRAFSQRTNLGLTMRVSPREGMNFPIEL